MASEVFLAVFHACFDVRYDASSESCLRWWINENIRDFIVPTYIRGDLPQPCTVRHEGHHPKVLLWIMEEFFYISHDLTEEDRNSRFILSYESMMEVEYQYRIKRGGGTGCHHSPSHVGSTPPCSPEMLEHIAWAKPESKTLKCLVWSVYDRLITWAHTKTCGPRILQPGD